MKINNKYNLKEEVYIGDEKNFVSSISIMDDGGLQYQLWNPNGNMYGTYSEWQMTRNKNNIGFDDNETN